MRPFPISQQWAWELVKRYGAVIGKYMHLHSFSHSFAINMVRHGVDIQPLQQVLGLASVSTTAVYLQFNDKDPARRMCKSAVLHDHLWSITENETRGPRT